MTNLKGIREERDLTQVELSTMAGVSERSIKRWEQGKPISIPNLIKVAKALDTTTDKILGLDNKEGAEQ